MGNFLSPFHARDRADNAKDKTERSEVGRNKTESSEAGTSSGSQYQVFLNFRGDTREKFTDHLYHGLEDAGICVFRDEEGLDFGEDINKALPRAIDNSRIYIPIFSQNYASSPWCLRELVQIVENASKSNGHKEILPIFLDVEPDDVKLKTPLYNEAMLKLNLARKDKLNTEPVKSWREALKKVGPMKGLEVKKYNGEAKLIKLVVEKVVKKLKMKQKSVTEHLIGIDDPKAKVIDMLDIGSGDGWLIQIHAIGGIGKTTLAKAVFNDLSIQFGKCCCFLEDVREKSSKNDGLVELQKKLLSEIGSAMGISNIDAIDHGMRRIEDTLSQKKVFIVLDDVDKSEQVEILVGKGYLCSGSRVLITTRKEDVLGNIKTTYGIKKYEMEMMSSDHALKLFSRHAFDKDSPSNDRYDISKEIVHATRRLPLTIKVIGSMLRGKENKRLWEETLDKLSITLPEAVYEKLKISYDALTPEQQQIFLDIACLLIGEKQTKAIHMWSDYDLSPIDGIEVLCSWSMIKIGENNEFLMHDHLRDLGRRIVHRENLMNPEERSRLWIKEEVLDAIKTKETKNVEAMELDLYHKEESIKSEDIGRFKKLRFLRLRGGTFVGDLKDCFPKLRWIDWCAFDPGCKPPNMCLKNVVVIEFSMMGIDDLKFQSLIKEARKLKVLSLIGGCITRIPDLSGCSTLEELIFQGCKDLRKIDNSIGKLKCLGSLVLKGCCEIGELPTLPASLTHLAMSSMSFQVVLDLSNLTNLVKLDLSDAIDDLEIDPSDDSEIDEEDGRIQTGDLRWIEKLSNLEELNLCLLHVPAPNELASLLKLNRLHLSGLDLQNFTQGPSSLFELTLENFISTPLLSSSLNNLSELILVRSQMQEIKFDGNHLPNLTVLSLNDCESLEKFMLSSMRKLKEVYANDCPKLDEIHIVGVLESLEVLHIDCCKSFGRLVYDDKQGVSSQQSSLILASGVLNKLRNLWLQHCYGILSIQVVGTLESLDVLSLYYCHHLQSLDLSNLKYLNSLSISGVHEFCTVKGLDELKFLSKLSLDRCRSLESLSDVLTTQLSEDCDLTICHCPKLCGVALFSGSIQDFKNYKVSQNHPQ